VAGVDGSVDAAAADGDAGFGRVPEQPAAAVSDAGREVSVRMLSARARGAYVRPAGPSHAESTRSRLRQGGPDQSAHRD